MGKLVMKKILVVDDEPHVRRIMQLTLQKNGYEVKTAQDGVAGLDIIRKEVPDAIVLDIEMPRMNGIDMCKTFYQEFPDTSCKIFIASSRAEDKFRDWIDEYSKVTFIEKPVSVRSLVEELRKALPSND